MAIDDILLSSRVSRKGAEMFFSKYGRVVFSDYLVPVISNSLNDRAFINTLQSVLDNPDIKRVDAFFRPKISRREMLDYLLDSRAEKGITKPFKISYNTFNVIHAFMEPKYYFDSFRESEMKKDFKNQKLTLMLRWDFPDFKYYDFREPLDKLMVKKARFEKSLRTISDILDFSYLLNPVDKGRVTKLKKEVILSDSLNRNNVYDKLLNLVEDDGVFESVKNYLKLFRDSYGFGLMSAKDVANILSEQIILSKSHFDNDRKELDREIDRFNDDDYNANYHFDFREGNLDFVVNDISLIQRNDKPVDFNNVRTLFMDIERPLWKYDDNIISWNSVVTHDEKDNVKNLVLTVHNLGFDVDWAFDKLGNEENLIKYTAKYIDSFGALLVFAYNYVADLGEMKKRSKNGEFSFGVYKSKVTQDSSVNFFNRLKNKNYQPIDLLAFAKFFAKALPNRKLQTVAKAFLGENEFSKSINYDEMELLEKKIMGETIDDKIISQYDVSDEVRSALLGDRTKASRLILRYSMDDSVVIHRLVYEKFNWMFDAFAKLSNLFDIPPYRAFTFSSILDVDLKKQFSKTKMISDFNYARVMHDFFHSRKRDSVDRTVSEIADFVKGETEMYIEKLDNPIKVRGIRNLVSDVVSRYESIVKKKFGIIKDVSAKFERDFLLKGIKSDVKNGYFNDVSICYLPFGMMFSDVLINTYGSRVKEFVNSAKSEFKRDGDFNKLTFYDTYLKELLQPMMFDFMSYSVVDEHKVKLDAFKNSLYALINGDFVSAVDSGLVDENNVKNSNQLVLLGNENKEVFSDNDKIFLRYVIGDVFDDVEQRSHMMNKPLLYFMGVFNSKYGNGKDYFSVSDFKKSVENKINGLKSFIDSNGLEIVANNRQLFVKGLENLSDLGMKELANYFYPLNRLSNLIVVNHRPIFKQFGYYNIRLKDDGGFHNNQYESYYLQKTIDSLLEDDVDTASSFIRDGSLIFDKLKSFNDEQKVYFFYFNKSKEQFIGFDKRFGKISFYLYDSNDRSDFENKTLNQVKKKYKDALITDVNGYRALKYDDRIVYFMSVSDFEMDVEAYKNKFNEIFRPFLNYIDDRKRLKL